MKRLFKSMGSILEWIIWKEFPLNRSPLPMTAFTLQSNLWTGIFRIIIFPFRWNPARPFQSPLWGRPWRAAIMGEFWIFALTLVMGASQKSFVPWWNKMNLDDLEL